MALCGRWPSRSRLPPRAGPRHPGCVASQSWGHSLRLPLFIALPFGLFTAHLSLGSRRGPATAPGQPRQPWRATLIGWGMTASSQPHMTRTTRTPPPPAGDARAALLRQALLGTRGKVLQFAKQTPMLAAMPRAQRASTRAARRACATSFRVLAAPGLRDDFYLIWCAGRALISSRWAWAAACASTGRRI